MNPDQIRAAIKTALAEMRAAHEALEADGLTDERQAELRSEFEVAEARHTELVGRLARADALASAEPEPEPEPEPAERGAVEAAERAERAARSSAKVTEPAVYGPHEPRRSYFLDLARATIQGDGNARQRLDHHATEVRDEIARRERRRAGEFDASMREMLSELPTPLARAIEEMGFAEQRALTTVDGAGGDFVPPLYLVDQYVAAARAGRPFVNACRNIALPTGTDSINVPKISTGTAAAIQATQGSAVQSTDLVSSTITAPVRTIAGQQDIALQLLEQSPIAFDQVIFADLTADYMWQTELQALAGTGSSGQLRGILNVSGVNSVTYTDASPTVPELYPKIADALQQARTARKRPITNGWLAPRRFYWAAAALDASNRPLVVPSVQGPYNALGVPTGQLGGGSGQDLPLSMLGVSHQITDGIPVNLGAGTNEDRIIETRNDDHLFFEGALRARVLPEVLSGNLQVRLQVYSYVAFTAERYPAATSIISGTGLVTPTF